MEFNHGYLLGVTYGHRHQPIPTPTGQVRDIHVTVENLSGGLQNISLEETPKSRRSRGRLPLRVGGTKKVLFGGVSQPVLSGVSQPVLGGVSQPVLGGVSQPVLGGVSQPWSAWRGITTSGAKDC